MSERGRRMLIVAAGGLAFFVFGLWLTFPMGLVARVIEAQAEKALDFRYDVSIERASLSGLSGVRLRGVEVIPVGTPPEGQVWLPTRIDMLRARVGLFSLGGPVPRARVDARIGDGSLTARVAPGGDVHARVTLDVEELPLQRLDIVRQLTGMPLNGALTGGASLGYNDELRLSGGEVGFTIPALTVGPGAVRSSSLRQVGGSLPIGATDFGAFAMRATIEESSLAIERLDASGSDVQLDLSGRVELRDPICASRVAMQLRLALDERYVEENGLGVPLSSVTLLQRAQTAEGYVLSLSGLLCSLRPEPGAGRGAPAR